MFRKYIKFSTSWVDIKFASVVILREIHKGGFVFKNIKNPGLTAKFARTMCNHPK